MSAHTPGPWPSINAFSECGEAIAFSVGLYQTAVHAQEQTVANAHLLRFAPELLAACELFTKAAHDARDALNGAGIACPSSIAYAAERARAAIAST